MQVVGLFPRTKLTAHLLQLNADLHSRNNSYNITNASVVLNTDISKALYFAKASGGKMMPKNKCNAISCLNIQVSLYG